MAIRHSPALSLLLGFALGPALAHATPSKAPPVIRSLTLHQAIEMGMKANPAIRGAIAEIGESSARSDLSVRPYLPKLEVVGNVRVPHPQVGATVNQLLWDGGRTSGEIDLAEARADSSLKNLSNRRLEIREQIIESYYSLVDTVSDLETTGAMAALYRKIVDGIEKRRRQSAVSENESIRMTLLLHGEERKYRALEVVYEEKLAAFQLLIVDRPKVGDRIELDKLPEELPKPPRLKENTLDNVVNPGFAYLSSLEREIGPSEKVFRAEEGTRLGLSAGAIYGGNQLADFSDDKARLIPYVSLDIRIPITAPFYYQGAKDRMFAEQRAGIEIKKAGAAAIWASQWEVMQSSMRRDLQLYEDVKKDLAELKERDISPKKQVTLFFSGLIGFETMLSTLTELRSRESERTRAASSYLRNYYKLTERLKQRPESGT